VKNRPRAAAGTRLRDNVRTSGTGPPANSAGPGSVPNPILVWNACDPLFCGDVLARTTVRPCARL
jgi:hypothetical protein